MSGLRLALIHPDIALNVGACIRNCACFGAALDVVEPCGFPFSLRAARRAALDYADQVEIARHDDWAAFIAATAGRRRVLLTTKSAIPYDDYAFQGDEVLMLGRESAGAPKAAHAVADMRLYIPLEPGARSLNMAVAGAVALSEAARQRRRGSRSPR